MSNVLEEMRREVAREAAKAAARETSITSTIEAYRDVNIEETVIKEKIINKFNLSEEKAEEYMLGKNA